MPADRASAVQHVKEANDIVDVIGGYLTLHSVGGKFKGLCPFHDDHRPSFDVDPRWQNYRCWSCGKSGDVFTFVQEKERIDFREALEMLARRAGITLEKTGGAPQDRGRARMLEVILWAAEQYQRCLHDSPMAETARKYVADRGLNAETVARFGLGFAPPTGDWLVQRAAAAGMPDDILEKIGLIAQRNEGNGWYDRFRDRVIFPIRTARGQTIAFGGRILPTSPSLQRENPPPKYYNSPETPLFTKSEHLYGIDLARQAAATAGYLAVVEGYTDVLMAHQAGIPQVVATLGTSLTSRHVQHLRRLVPRVVLVFDADAGGAGGVDRALEIFVTQELELAVATLPQGLDPCDLLVKEGPEPFRKALVGAADALDFKLNQVLADGSATSVEGRRLAIDAVLGIIAIAPEVPGQGGQVKRELILSRIAHRLAVREETLWKRLAELRKSGGSERKPPRETPKDDEPKAGPAAPHERELLEVLLADPDLVPLAAGEIGPERIEHAGLRRLLQGLYRLQAAGERPELNRLREEIDVALAEYALKMQEHGSRSTDRSGWLQSLLLEFRRRALLPKRQELHGQLQGVDDHDSALELLRQLQSQKMSK